MQGIFSFPNTHNGKVRAMKKALVTGITGQDGAYLAKHLLDLGYEVIGLQRRTSGADNLARLRYLGIDKDIEFQYFDLCEPFNPAEVLRTHQPEEFYNLGAQSFVAASFKLPLYTLESNGTAVARLLETIKQMSLGTRVYQASTSEMFGAAPAPQNENTPFHPRSPYGVSKLLAYWWVRNYRESYGIYGCNGILFNHESPLRGVEFVTRKITRGVVDFIRTGQTIQLGNLDALRDWGHAEDYVKAMHLMLQQDKPDDYVLATGTNHSVREFCTSAAKHVGINIEWQGSGVDEKGIDPKTGRAVFAVSPEFFRPAEVDVLLGDASKAETVLGWTRKHTLDSMVAEMVAYDLRGGR